MALIDVSTRKHPNTFAIVDDADLEFFSQWKWHVVDRVGGSRYVERSCKSGGKKMHIFLHREILGLKKGDGVYGDHIDGNTLNNSRSNLRRCALAQNIANAKKHGTDNTSEFKGVCWDRARAKWVAQIKIHRRHIFLGRFYVEVDAARAYDAAAKLHFGEFARLNFP